MMGFVFTPTEEIKGIKVPYIEEARAAFAPYYDQRDKNPGKVQTEIITEMAKLGGSSVYFQEGYFESPMGKRYGFVVRFQFYGHPAKIEVAGLPIKNGETALKVLRVRLQALYNVRDWLKNAVTAQVFSPGSHPLMQYLLVDGSRTLAEAVIEDGHMPNMNPMLTAGEK